MSKSYLTAIAVTGLLFLAPVCFVRAQTVAGMTPLTQTTTVVVRGEKSRKTPHWFRAESQHFIVYSDATQPDVTLLLAKLERFRYALHSYSRIDAKTDADEPKFELYYLANPHDLSAVDPSGPDFSIGLLKSCEEGVQGYGVHMYYQASAKLPLEKQPENEGLSYIFQTYARHFFSLYSLQKTPTWFIDGFAQYFSTMRFDGNEAILGLAPEPFALYLRRIGSEWRYSLDYTDVLTGQEDNGHNYIGEAGVRNEFQARAWILTHYILSSHENLAKFHLYMDDRAQGEAPTAAFEHAFGIKASKINYTLWKYLHGGQLLASKLQFKALPEADVSFQAEPLSADRLLLWQSALKTCPDARSGAKLLTSIRSEAAKYPDSDLAQMTLSRAEILWGDPHSAIPYLTRTLTDTPNTFEARYLLGRAELALGEKESGPERTTSLAAASQNLMAAADLNPQSASTAYFLYRAHILNESTPDDTALGAAILAWRLAPEVDSYALAAGLAYAHLGRKEEALQALHSVAYNPRGRSLVAVARVQIEAINTGAEDSALIAAMRAQDKTPEGGLTAWTIASADVVEAVKNAANAEDAASVLDDPTTPDQNLPRLK